MCPAPWNVSSCSKTRGSLPSAFITMKTVPVAPKATDDGDLRDPSGETSGCAASLQAALPHAGG